MIGRGYHKKMYAWALLFNLTLNSPAFAYTSCQESIVKKQATRRELQRCIEEWDMNQIDSPPQGDCIAKLKAFLEASRARRECHQKNERK